MIVEYLELWHNREVPRPFPAPPERLDMATVLHALSDPARLAIVSQLDDAQDPVACGGFDVGVARSTLSHHFRVLREAGVIETHHAGGNTMLNQLRRPQLDAAFPGLLDVVIAGAATHGAPGLRNDAAREVD